MDFEPLFSPAEVQALGARVIDRLRTEARVAPAHGAEEVAQDGRYVALRWALGACAAAAGVLRDPALVPDVDAWIRQLPAVPVEREESAADAIRAGIGGLLGAGAPVDDVVRGLAASHDEQRRAVVAGHLMPATAEGWALLRRLAADPAPAVRTAARRNLERLVERAKAELSGLPGWAGIVAEDPRPGLTGPQREAWARVEELLCWYGDQLEDGQEALAADLARLPPPLAQEVLCGVLGTLHGAHYVRLTAVLLGYAEAPRAAVDVFHRLSRVRSPYRAGQWLEDLIQLAGGEVRERLLDAVAGEAWAALEAPDQRAHARALAGALGHQWPTDRDASPLLDLYLALGEVPLGAGDALRRPGLARERMAEAQRLGFPGRWAALAKNLERLLACPR